MDEFLKINWRVKHVSQLDTGGSFISEDVVADSLVYKLFEDKALFHRKPVKPMKNVFKQGRHIPGEVRINTNVKSCLNKLHHQLCLKALKVFHSGKDPSSYTASEQHYVDIFNKVKSKILNEQSQYQNFVCREWQVKDRKQLKRTKKRIITFGKTIWELKRKKITSYPRFFKELSLINTTFDENESIIDFVCTANVLDVGTLARFTQPNLKSPCILTNVTLPDVNCHDPNLPVSQDENITKILETHHNIDIVISASGLKCLTDTSDPKRRWMIPLVVKNIDVRTANGNVSRRVVFLDKPFSQNDVSHMDLAYISFKRLIKTNFCRFEAFKYDSNSSTLQDDDNKEFCSSGNYDFDRPQTSTSSNVIHQNASYRIWNIKKSYCHNNLLKGNHRPVEFNVLIRSKLDACEANEAGALQPVIIKPKLEMQLRFGANVPSKAELTRDWTSLFFTPFSNLYRVRIAPTNSEVICVEKCNIQKIVAEAQAHYHYKPQLGLGILQKVFEELTRLEPGNYLLQHLPKHEAFVAVMKECQDGKQGEVFDFHSEYDKVSLSEYPKTWLPIDANVVLPSFEASNRMPAMFTPKLRVGQFKKKSGAKKKKKNDL